MVHVFASQLAAALRGRELSREAATASELSKVNELRSALLVAVSHDFRTPLASIKASVTSLLADDVQWDETERREFCVTIDEEADRLANLVANLLDMSRLTTGAFTVHHVKVGVEEVVPAAIASLGDRGRHGRVAANVPESLPRIDTDPALLERAAREPHRERDRVVAGGATGARRSRRSVEGDPPPGHRPGPRHPGRRIGSESSSPSNGWAIVPTARVSVSASRWHRASSERSEASCTWRTRPAVVRPWLSPCPRSHDGLASGAGRRRRATAAARAHDEPQSARVRGRQGRDGRAGAGARGAASPGCRHPRPRPARHRRHRSRAQACAVGRRCRSSCSPRVAARRRRSPRSTPAQTTT